MHQEATLFKQALALHQQAKLEEAKSIYEIVLSMNPNHFDAHNLLGTIALQLGQYQHAVNKITQAIAINSRQASPYNNRGIAFKELGQLDAAVDNYQMAIKLKPEYAEAYYNRGIALKELRQFEAAIASYDMAIKLNPNDAETHYNRGIALKEVEQFEAAIASYNLAIRLRPNYADAYMNRGNAQLVLHRYSEAVEDYTRSIQIRPNYAQAHYNCGNALQEMRQLDAAIASYDQAIALDNNLADAFLNKGLCLLLKGDFELGWSLYEWRWQTNGLTKHQRHFLQPLWLGQMALKGKTLLVHSEQGLGDTIQFCRYLRLIKEMGAHIIFEVPRNLCSLLRELDSVDILLEQGQALPPFDYHCPLLSLPLACKDFIKSIPCGTPYLQANAGRLAIWQQRLGAKTKPRIGLAWSGNADHRNDRKRSIPLSTLLPHLSNEFDYVCLQKDVRDDDKAILSKANILCFGDELKDFSDTAALVELMDVVISVDTSVAHLAGALGKSSCLLLAYLPDWRWGLDTTEIIWYQSMHLYRQGADRTWPPVFAKVADDLQQQYTNR